MPAGREETGCTEDATHHPSLLPAANPVPGETWQRKAPPEQQAQSYNRKRPQASKMVDTNLSIVHTAEGVRKRRREQTAVEEDNQPEVGTGSDGQVLGPSASNGQESIQGPPASKEDEPSEVRAASPTLLTPGEDIQSLIRRVTMETRQLFSKWQEPFKESEDFESFCLLRVDQLLKEAKTLEQSLEEHKERLQQRLGSLSSSLIVHSP